MRSSRRLVFWACLLAAPVEAQDRLQEILARLERLEEEVRALRREVEDLKTAVAGGRAEAREARLAERMEVQEARTAELAQTKVQSSSRFPVELTGILLFNLFANGACGSGQYPTVAAFSAGPRTAGGSLRQSVLGSGFHGPQVAGGGKISGVLHADFWAGSDSALNHVFRIRTAMLSSDWRHFSISAGQDKPLISPREPESLAQVGVSPLTGAGNPWLWQPRSGWKSDLRSAKKPACACRARYFRPARAARWFRISTAPRQRQSGPDTRGGSNSGEAPQKEGASSWRPDSMQAPAGARASRSRPGPFRPTG